MSAKILNEFIFHFFLPVVISTHCPTKINLRTKLKEFLLDRKYDVFQSESMASDLLPDLIRRLSKRLESWERLGLPFPFCQSEEKNELYITWRHGKYEELTGYDAISENFVATLEWIDSLSPRDFLIPCALYLKLIGATKIFITDGPRDGGIDLIARIQKNPFNSTVFFVQAKTSQQQLSRDTVLMEYGKYISLPHEEAYFKYRRALDLDNSDDGATFCYAILANTEFHNAAKEIANKLGILLRSRIQLAYYLSQKYNIIKLKELDELKLLDLKIDLSLNLATKLPEEVF